MKHKETILLALAFVFAGFGIFYGVGSHYTHISWGLDFGLQDYIHRILGLVFMGIAAVIGYKVRGD